MARPVTTAARAAMTKSQEAPVFLAPSVKRPEVGPQTEVARYVVEAGHVGKNHQIKIVAIAGDEADQALTRTVMTHHPDGLIRFQNFYFGTPHISVARWLDARIAAGMLRHVARTTEGMRLRCEHCEKAVYNTKEGREELARHQIEDHLDLIYGEAYPEEAYADAGA
jgi:hypothetical protein